MTTYRVVDETTGMSRESAALADVLPIAKHETLIVLDPPVETPPPIVPRTTFSRASFMRRLGFSRETLVNAVRLDAATPIATRAALETLTAWLARVSEVDVTDPITVLGVGTIAQVVVAAGDLAAQDVDQFAADWLALPTDAEP